jgi:hypothetical protein
MDEPNAEVFFTEAKEEIRVKKAVQTGSRSNPSAASVIKSIGAGWKARLLIGKRGRPLAVVANALIALRDAPNGKEYCTSMKAH